MKISGNTILITGGGSGIGKALAEQFHAKGNNVVIAGRNVAALEAVASANPGMSWLALDIGDAASIQGFASELIARHPDLNIVLNNAGIMELEDLRAAPGNLDVAERTIATNLLGPIRLTSALLPHLQRQPSSSVIMVSSGLAFVPLAVTPTYSATKSAIHAYAMSLRHQLRDSPVEVIEIVPPYVQTELQGEHQAHDPRAMPLAEFIEEVVAIIEADPAVEEVVVERCNPLRYAVRDGIFDQVFAGLNAHAPD